MERLVAAPDKFRGTATAAEAASAMARAGEGMGWGVTRVPMSDGGEGLLEVLEGRGFARHRATVTGPLGLPVDACWLSRGDVAVVETADASGLSLAGGRGSNDPMGATSFGTGQLMAMAATEVGPGGTVVVGLGGSASTDGGSGAVRAVGEAGGLGGVHLIGACDVEARFDEAARLFGPQKGADEQQVEALELRLVGLAARYREEFGVDVGAVPGAAAAGGLGGGVLALGGRLRSGFELVAELVGLGPSLAGADLVVTGEGRLDRSSFAGKVVSGVCDAAGPTPVLMVVGRADDDAVRLAEGRNARVVSLVHRFGEERAVGETIACIESAVREAIDDPRWIR